MDEKEEFMIKRAGVEILCDRSKMVSIAKENLLIFKNKSYISLNGNLVDLSNDIHNAVNGTILYKEFLTKKQFSTSNTSLEITNETTAQAGYRFLQSGKKDIVVLNFASAKNPGGGFLSGASCQEEDLCRASALYSCLKRKPMFYNENILCDSPLYTDNVIYSPDVPFFRNEYNLFIEEPFKLSIISAPAPNVRSLIEKEKIFLDDLKDIFRRRILKILKIADAHNHKTIILGAWGCGAFGNSPNLVANVFKEALKNVPTFEHVCFAVYDNKENAPTFSSFKDILLGE